MVMNMVMNRSLNKPNRRESITVRFNFRLNSTQRHPKLLPARLINIGLKEKMYHKYIVWVLCVLLMGCSATSKDVRTYKRQHDVEKLINIVNNSSDKEVRIEAINALAYIRDPRAISGLTQATTASSWVEREAAIKSLGRLKDHLVIKPIVNVLDDSNKFVRESAAKALYKVVTSLGKKKDPRVSSHLIKAIKSNTGKAREVTIAALRRAFDELSRANEKSILKVLIVALDDENKYVRKEAVLALGRLDDPRVITPLTTALKDPFRDVRDIASEALSKVRDPRSSEPLFAALKDNSAFVRDEAAKALGQFKEPRIVRKVIRALGDDNDFVREGAAKAMGYLVHPRAMKLLVNLLDDFNADVRLAAGKSLQSYHWQPADDAQAAKYCVSIQKWEECASYGETAIHPLAIALKGDDSEVRRKASAVLSELQWQPSTNKEKALYCVAKQNWKECVQLGKNAIKPLIQELDNEDWRVRVSASQSLAEINNEQAVEPLIKRADDKNADVRIAIVEALGGFHVAGVIEPLIQALDDNNRAVRQVAAEKLEASVDKYRELDDPQIIVPFVTALKDNNRSVRVTAAQLLGKFNDPRAVEPLIAALKDIDGDVRSAARQSLREIKDNRAISTLVKALDDSNPEIRSQIVGALSDYKDHRAIEPLLEALNDTNASVRIKAIKVLSGIQDPRAIDPLIRALKDGEPNVRIAAAVGLAKFNDSRIIKPLVLGLTDINVGARQAIQKTLLSKEWQPKNPKEEAHYCVAKRDWIRCAQLGKVALAPLLLELKQPESPVQVDAARILGEIKDASVIPALIAAISATQWSDDDFKSKKLIRSASNAIFKFGYQAVPVLKKTLTQWYTSQHTANILTRIGWEPRSNEDEIHYLVAKRADSDLKALWPDAKQILLNDIASQNTDKLNYALYAFIGIGKEEVIGDLLHVLKNHGTVQIAEAYLNSGHKDLVSGAENWSSQRGLEVYKYGDGYKPVLWGQLELLHGEN